MGSGKSPVDELVDGIDAVGTILNESMPQINHRLQELEVHQNTNINALNALQQSYRELNEGLEELGRAVGSIDMRIEEVSVTMTAISRRLDQIQQTLLGLSDILQTGGADNDLVDTVKMLEDRLKRLEATKKPADDEVRFRSGQNF